MVQLTISRPSNKDLFKDLLNGIKGFKNQIALKVLLSKYKENAEREFAPVYFRSTTNTVIDFEDSLDRSLVKTFNRIDNWIGEVSA